MPSYLYKKRNVGLFVVVCALLLLISACASTQQNENTIENRATQRWEALLSGDLPAAYEFLSPGYRSSVSSLQYQRTVLMNKIKWSGARYIESDCTESICKVTISLDYIVYGGLPGVQSFEGNQTVEESWILTEGNWYFVPKK